MTTTHTRLFGAIVFNLVVGVGCSAGDSTEDDTGAASGTQDVSTSTTTPDAANERVVKLLRAEDINRRPGPNTYEGYLTATKDCRLTVTWYEESDFLTVSTTEVVGYGLAAKPVGEPLEFVIQGKTSFRDTRLSGHPGTETVQHADASTISKWKETDGKVTFTVTFDGKSADVSLSTAGKDGLSLKTTIDGRTLECKGLRAQAKPSGE